MIRRAGPGDADLVAALEAACASHPWSAAAVASTLALPTTSAWIAQDPAIGYLVTSHAASEAEILTVGVLPTHRRAGIGRALLSRAIDAWRSDGVEQVFLEVRSDNVAARALYSSLGWEEIAVRRGYYADGADAAVMRLRPRG